MIAEIEKMTSNQKTNATTKKLDVIGDRNNAELEWIRFREDLLGPTSYHEANGSKLLRKIKENPFVPVGAFATFGALSYGLWCFRQGRGRDSQMMMRARIAAQGFTVVALMMGVTTTPRYRDDGNVIVKTEPCPKDAVGR